MRRQNSLPYELVPEADGPGAGAGFVDNVVPLFAPNRGSLAALIAAASGPAELAELSGESEIKATFRAAMLERPPARRRLRMAPIAIAASTMAGLVAGTAGLSAAAVLPPAANHVVAQVLSQVGIDVAPKSHPAAGPSASAGSPARTTRPPRSPRSTPPAPPATPSATAAAATHRANQASARACEDSATGTPTLKRHAANQMTNAQKVAVLTALDGQTLPLCPTPAPSHGSKASGSSPPSTGSTGGGSASGSGSGSGSGTGTGSGGGTSGGGTGTGSGGGTGTGGGTGSGSGGGTGTGGGTGNGSGTGSNKGGNQGGHKGGGGKGGGKGGKHGGGNGGGHHGGHHGNKGNGAGSGTPTPVGTGPIASSTD